MSKFLLVFSLLFGCSLSAQKAFFIKPRMMMKTTRSSPITEGFFIKENAVNHAYNGYYTFVNDGYHFSDSKLNFGISAGVKFNKKNSLELVVSADGSSVKRSFVYYNKMDPDFPSTVSNGSLIWGRDFLRLNLEYNRTYFSKERYNLRSSIGCGIFLLHKRTEIRGGEIGNHIFNGNVINKNTNWNNWAAVFQVGLGIDFKTKKNVHLFSFDVFATMNFKTITQAVTTDVNLYDSTDGSTHTFSHTLVSRGSGINFQLSRPIQVYPWRPNKKPKTAL